MQLAQCDSFTAARKVTKQNTVCKLISCVRDLLHREVNTAITVCLLAIELIRASLFFAFILFICFEGSTPTLESPIIERLKVFFDDSKSGKVIGDFRDYKLYNVVRGTEYQ